MQPVFVLLHSPSVGPSTWRPVAEHLTAEGYQVRVPSLLHIGAGARPFWPRVVSAVRDDLRQVPADRPVTLVAHSDAGLFLPTVRSALDHPVTGSIFVDAALPARTEPAAHPPALLLRAARPGSAVQPSHDQSATSGRSAPCSWIQRWWRCRASAIR